ncbi:MAG: ATP-dependent metallopeptidase FtsH/Yme1/Tma family protein [Deltaproteobacteria bacterium]|nr:MAG: ATP-dependent metallopeptidase FtsH/Yme1/Tma family protein [Deltaproteobacteria bacterium]
MKNLSRNNIFWLIAIALLLGVFWTSQVGLGSSSALEYSEFQESVAGNNVKDVVIQGQKITGKFLNEDPFSTTGPVDHTVVGKLLDEHQVRYTYEPEPDNTLWTIGLTALLPLGVMVLLFFWLMRNLQGTSGRAMNFGKSKARLHSDSTKRVTFDDVAGIDESKEELEEIVEFLKDPRRFTRLGGRIPKGVLLMGPPGTGKTLLARAVAGEAGVPFFSISGSDFVEMFVGVGASRVRDLFEQGRKHAPCIIFIDEIDAVGRHRGTGLGGGHDEREQTLNQLLVEMDGFEGTEGVILVAATNRPDVLDPALLRPGRFDRRIAVPAPDVRGREQILQIHSRRIPLADAVDLTIVARRTPGFSGADLENLCNEAALLAARKDKRQVDPEDFDAAVEKIYMGPEQRSRVMPEPEKRTTAYHEAGHAIVSHFLPGHEPVHKITIIPRGRALGVTMYLQAEDRLSHSRSDMLKRITSAMGGRAAEQVKFSHYTSGAQNDLKQATRIARMMIMDLGMSEDLGPVSWGDGDDEPFLGRSMAQPKSFSEETSRRIDSEVRAICQRAYDTALSILTQNQRALERVAEALLEHESLTAEQFTSLVEESDPVPPEGIQWMLTPAAAK